ncbi:hypothetical protein SERLADRAFT_355396 [Serpula lacrymans var. lacrymans S7.9]|uniref:non-specific serine/threonine protein kinase n=1 Tax=Serpula lacrymans var. lacrymans (strain S7.9) TaxID=578457 RepID=F8NR63_SERL9|nr:uncharacterized protein SERLADRAFT_355396 [Serpula lacrymans var. lacrymans S7.9]EGO26710.1 hypothetical protein SERLADRAFT_355396 [Serpula lacrymans var. lacrymans S7.9]
MGNAQSTSTLTRTTGALDSFVAELGGDVVYDKSLGQTRFLKTVKCRHRSGYLVIKIFIKPDPGITLRSYHRRLKMERESLSDIANVYNYQSFVETDKAGYIIRQWIASNLYDRISTRPFLSAIEKKWIAFQLLNALRDARNRKVAHGDIKSTNILVTSWNWVYLTDFAAQYKPTFLPLDDPADFSFFFDTSGRRTCYVAPERFYTATSNPEVSAKKNKLAGAAEEGVEGSRRDGRVTESMDCFSAGCVIAELFLEGAPLFSLSQLFKYREGEYNVDGPLSAIDDDGIRSIIKQMIALDPTTRPTFDTLLHTSRGSVFPECFYSFLHNYVSSINDLPTRAETTSDALPSDSDNRLERIWEDYEGVEPYLLPDTAEQTVMDVKLEYGLEDGPALIILSLVSANIRNCALPSSRLRALDLFLALACHLTDEAKLDRMVPYIVDLLHDEAAIVRSAALRTLMQVLMLVTVITPSNVSIFPEYIIPNMKYLVQDPEVSVRCIYAQCIVQLADTAVRYLEMGQALKAHGAYKMAPSSDKQEYDDGHFEVNLQTSIQEQLSALLMDPSSIVKRAILHNISSLCIFLGRQKTNDVLLSHMITYLNDRDWLLRCAFFESIVDVAACAGGRSLDEYILPLMIQALSDVEETVVARVLAALTSLCELELFHKMRIWELMSATLGFFYHPNVWIRQGAAAFIASAAKYLPTSDVWCILYPSLRHLLRSDIKVIDEQSLLTSMKSPLSRQVFDAAVQWAMKAEKTGFWKGHRRTASKVESPRESIVIRDEAQLAKLHNLGMTTSEEAKLLALRDYILKLANATSSFASRLRSEPEAEKNLRTIGDIEMQKLAVVPQTVFLKSRASLDVTPRSSRIVSASRRSTFDLPGRIGTPRMSRASSIDHGNSGAPFEDLRRRLATINGSASSLSHPSPRDRRSPLMAVQPMPAQPVHLTAAALSLDRPNSPTESVVSTTNSSTIRTAHRLQVGSTDGQKAAPAIGSSNANATGLLEAPSKFRSDGSPERSGRSSPVSVAGTARGSNRPRVPSLLPISTYDGQEPGISNLLENLYLDNNRELQNDFGPKVHEGPTRRRNAARHSFAGRDNSSRRAEATLIAHLHSHSDTVTGLAVSPDHIFFVSSSDDKTVKVWDTARLERNVTSKPRHTYGQHHARVKCVCMLENVHCFASAADDGSLHVVRVHVNQSGALPKYSKLQVIREHRVDHAGEYITCMSHYNSDTSSNLVYATTHSVITILDLRTMRILQTMQNPRHLGPISCMCIDRKRSWIIVGTSMGTLTLWDRRFGLLLKSWQVGKNLSGRSSRIHQCVVHPTKGRGRWIMVAVETSKMASEQTSTTLIEVWDIEKTVLVESYTTRTTNSSSDPLQEPKEHPGADAEESPAAAIAALVRSRQAGTSTYPSLLARNRGSSQSIPREDSLPAPSLDIRAVIVGLEFGGHSTVHRLEMADMTNETNLSNRSTGRGFMVSGSEDRRIRLWDLTKLERTSVLVGLDSGHDRPSYSTIRGSTGSAVNNVESWLQSSAAASHNNRPPQRMSLITHNQQTLLKSHQDIITALACIDSPFRGGIVSGDRAGVIKVWRVGTAD